MEKLLSKLSKTLICTIISLTFTTIILQGDVNLGKTNDKQINEIVIAAPLIDNHISIEQPSLSHKDFVKEPLDEHELIDSYIRDISTRYNIEPELIMSIVQQESDYNPKAKNGKCLGLMQVSTYWHDDRAARLGVTDFYDAYGNILLGVDYLSELFKQYKDKTLVLMLYSMDHDTAFRMYKNGQISSYAKTVIARAENYKKGV
jgi:hypothetical protein